MFIKVINEIKQKIGISEDCPVILCSASLGDTFIVCSYMEAFHEEKKVRPVLIIRKSHEDVVRMFESGAFKYLTVSGNEMELLRDGIMPDKSLDKIMAFHAQEPYILFGHIGLNGAGKYKDPLKCPDSIRYPEEEAYILRLYRTAVLGLSNQARGHNPGNIAEIDEDFYINRYGIIPGKTCIIFPESSPVLFSADLWNYIAGFLRAKGYHTLFNLTPMTPDNMRSEFDGDIIDMPVGDVVKTVELCGNAVALRSGICDIMSACCGINLTVIYAQNDGKEFVPLEDWSLKTMWGMTQTNEIVFDTKYFQQDATVFIKFLESILQ